MNSEDIRASNVAWRVRWKRLMKQHAGKINVEFAKSFLADHYGPWLQKENPGSRTLILHLKCSDETQNSQNYQAGSIR